MIARIERILHKLAQQNAPQLIPQGWNERGDTIERIQKLARQLAAYNILVLVGELEASQLKAKDLHIHDWIQGYGRLYNLLAQALFPSFSRITAQYADDRLPPVVVIHGQATPVVHVLAGLVTPYLAIRQPRRPISELELRGLMDVLLDELEASDLPRAAYHQLQVSGVAILKQLLEAGIRHISLTTFDRPILNEIQSALPASPAPSASSAAPQITQAIKQPLYQLDYLPEENVPHTPTEEMFRVDIPLPEPRPAAGPRRRPPVPPLPGDDKR